MSGSLTIPTISGIKFGTYSTKDTPVGLVSYTNLGGEGLHEANIVFRVISDNPKELIDKPENGQCLAHAIGLFLATDKSINAVWGRFQIDDGETKFELRREHDVWKTQGANIYVRKENGTVFEIHEHEKERPEIEHNLFAPIQFVLECGLDPVLSLYKHVREKTEGKTTEINIEPKEDGKVKVITPFEEITLDSIDHFVNWAMSKAL